MEFFDRIGLTQFVQTLTWLDMALIIVIGLMTIWGLWSGLVWQVYRIVSLVLGFALASRFGPALAEKIGDRISNDLARRLLCYVLVFFGVVIGCYLIGRLVKKLIDRVKLGPADRLFGALFGFLKGSLICGAIIIGILNAAPADSSWVKPINDSRVAMGIVKVCQNLWILLPEEVQQRVREKIQKARENMEEKKAGVKEKLKEKAKEAIDKQIDSEIDKRFDSGGEKKPPGETKKDDAELAPTADGVE